MGLLARIGFTATFMLARPEGREAMANELTNIERTATVGSSSSYVALVLECLLVN